MRGECESIDQGHPRYQIRDGVADTHLKSIRKKKGE